MKTLRTITLITFISAMFIVESCKKEPLPIEGCINSNADNYDALAEKDCNCCKYTGNVIFWQGQEKAQKNADAGITLYRVYLENDYIGSVSATEYFTTQAKCDFNGGVKYTKSLGGSQYKSHGYKVENNLGVIIQEGIINFEGGKCTSIEIK